MLDGFYGRLLIAMNKTAPTAIIAITMAIVEIAKYISVGGSDVAGCSVGCRGESFTTKAVSVCDGQYDSEPLKLAITVYLPAMLDCHSRL